MRLVSFQLYAQTAKTCIRLCRAQMARHDSQLARSESASVRPLLEEAIGGMLLSGLAGPSMPSVLPEVSEAGGRKLGVPNDVLNVLMPKVVL